MSENIVHAPAGENYFTIRRNFEAPRRLIYKCYTEPQHMAHFWGPRETTLAECRIDLRVGGVWKVRWQYPDGRSWGYASVYLAITPDSELHYRDAPNDWVFGLDGLPPVELDSTIALADQGRNTLVTVTVRCASVAARDENLRRGFSGMVSVGNDRLAEYLRTIDLATV
jgi:uncharacterized protein YndB with AHSA1/START domain